MADFTDEADYLLAQLGVEVETRTTSSLTSQEERIISGFEEIQKFVVQKGRLPQHGEDHDIFERLYAVRLDRLRELPEREALLTALDYSGILIGATATKGFYGDQLEDLNDLDADELLAALGVEDETSDITTLTHVRPSAKKLEEEMATRARCSDFDKFRPLFDQIKDDLKNKIRISKRFENDAKFEVGHFFILEGQTAYVAEMGELFTNDSGHINSRLRVIFDNGTESNLLMRSLERALQKDETGRRISDPSAGPLFSNIAGDGDVASGTIYILRSNSTHQYVTENREILHKIGVTAGSVKKRIADAENDPTFLMASVEVVKTYELYNMNRTKMENLLHQIFSAAKLNLEIQDRFGKSVRPQEWFLVPLFSIEEAIQRLQNDEIINFIYDVETARFVSSTGSEK